MISRRTQTIGEGQIVNDCICIGAPRKDRGRLRVGVNNVVYGSCVVDPRPTSRRSSSLATTHGLSDLHLSSSSEVIREEGGSVGKGT